ncbi:protein of unknown function [Methanoculleus bourgensis]|uniref:Uncharacterized protein n=1 Tax=Methanoculleus bourgensis TaxID=83986 RepID=A0A0X3BPM1_9EURY|nr:protein of unknown function [Methanoculleus bourgensis]
MSPGVNSKFTGCRIQLLALVNPWVHAGPAIFSATPMQWTVVAIASGVGLTGRGLSPAPVSARQYL